MQRRGRRDWAETTQRAAHALASCVFLHQAAVAAA
jgi:hypothetical protein